MYMSMEYEKCDTKKKCAVRKGEVDVNDEKAKQECKNCMWGGEFIL